MSEMLPTVIDIETIPDLSIINDLPEPEVALGNIKDADKIAAKIEAAKISQRQKMALSPLTGKICAIGYGEEYFGLDITVDIRSEKEMIIDFFKRISLGKNRIVTFNGNNFDLPFIWKRAIILGIEPSFCIGSLVKRYSTAFHFDILQVWSGWNSQGYEKMDFISKRLLGECKKDFDHCRTIDLLQSEAGQDVLRDYCSKDVELTYKLYNKIKTLA